MNMRVIALRYCAFAVVATVANLGAQRLVLLWGDGRYVLLFAIGLGTAVGLVVKYLLDKRWIFYDMTEDLSDNSRKFALYTLTGVVTTAIFWGMELAFWTIWETHLMREIGAVVGLAIGYFTKFRLDSAFVFPNSNFSKRSAP